VQRELFMNVLNAHATKRDAKQYLARFRPPKSAPKDAADAPSPLQQERNARHRQDQDRLDRIGVNLGGLYAPARAIAETPQFTREEVDEKAATTAEHNIHVALVCLRAPETLDDATLDGVALTLSQLVKLDMRILVVLDAGRSVDGSPAALRDIAGAISEQAERLTRAIGRHSPEAARFVAGVLETIDDATPSDAARPDRKPTVTATLPKLLLDPLRRSIIPIVPTLAYASGGRTTTVSASSVMEALTALMSGLPQPSGTGGERQGLTTTLERIIILDTAGGIPSKARGDGAHVFINLEQEYSDIETELADYSQEVVKDEHGPGMLAMFDQHRSNLSMTCACLALLPSASSALIITPQEAASSSQTSDDNNIGAGTRRRKNTLIHNLLTNKPMVSSSLPVARLPSANPAETTTMALPRATLVKRGMPVTIIPNPDPGVGWLPPPTGRTTLDLETDPRVDLPRLVHLIDDSFRRKLDVADYLARIRGRVAGLIIAGEYEGGAILTWESPPGAPSDDASRLVPYLDKFAVLGTSQGSSGVADIVFQSMVRSCFPHGVVWRSRRDNPVNKWYFERSEGTWRIPGSKWMMFWTGQGPVGEVGEGDEQARQRWEDYVGVCKSIGASWDERKERSK
jgi:amino-acid N-acetyltransferase